MDWTDTESAEDMDMDTMDKRSKVLTWTGMIGGGALSIAANLQSIHLPTMPGGADAAGLAAWHALPDPEPSFMAYVWAVAFPFLALFGVELVSHAAQHLHPALRFGVLGFAAAVAVATSYTHIVTVLLWSGQPVFLAVIGPAAIDGVMLLCSIALFTAPKVSTDTDTPDAVTVQPDTDKVWTWTPEPTVQPDSLYVPDGLDTPAPVDIVDRVPAPRRPRPASGWKVSALDMIRTGEPATDREIAEKILADAPETWATVEAGRKAVSRLRSAA